ncbi:MAG: hypothetical protein MRY79_01290 [Alphaproteobacteria bacterium]|nr:hypothetical protein [Alphaproteobacteria bacterium]
MTSDKFDMDKTLTPKSFAAFFNAKDKGVRDKFRVIALRLLRLTHEHNLPFNENSFNKLLQGIEHALREDQKSVVRTVYLDASNAYQQWCQNNPQKTSSRKRASTSLSSLHGGSGYTGRLRVGFAAPGGSESHQSDDDPREGLTSWVKQLTAAGCGAGHSLSELSGKKQPKSSEIIMPVEDLRNMTKNQLLNILDTANNPGIFLKAVLTYYNQPVILLLGNITVNSHNINNPNNIRSVSQLDSIYNHMQKLDSHDIMTPMRAMRFLVLCSNLLGKVKAWNLHEEKAREVSMAKMEIEEKLQEVSSSSGISIDEMQRQIASDKRKKPWETLKFG